MIYLLGMFVLMCGVVCVELFVFDLYGVYLVVGGMGGFGFVSVCWMVEYGVCWLMFVSCFGEFIVVVCVEVVCWYVLFGVIVDVVLCDVIDVVVVDVMIVVIV